MCSGGGWRRCDSGQLPRCRCVGWKHGRQKRISRKRGAQNKTWKNNQQGGVPKESKTPAESAERKTKQDNNQQGGVPKESKTHSATTGCPCSSHHCELYSFSSLRHVLFILSGSHPSKATILALRDTPTCTPHTRIPGESIAVLETDLKFNSCTARHTDLHSTHSHPGGVNSCTGDRPQIQ